MADTKLLVIFIVLNVVNVIMQTVKSIATVKCGKGVAAIVNAVTFALYTVVTVYMMCELPLMWKAGIVGLCNLIGVFVVKWVEEVARKDKLWKVEMTIPTVHTEEVDRRLAKVPHSYITISDKHTLFNFYCATQKESAMVKEIGTRYNAKFFVAESKVL